MTKNHKTPRLLMFIFMLAMLFVFAAQPVYAGHGTAHILVNTTADEDGTGADCSLREAVETANGDGDYGGCTSYLGAYGADDTIEFDVSLAGQTILLTEGSSIVIDSDLIIDNVSGGVVTIDGNASDRIFSIQGSTVVINGGADGLIIQNGDSNMGGAILNSSSNLTIDNITFDNNNASEFGGAIFNDSNLNVFASSFTNNAVNGSSAYLCGGAIYNVGNVEIRTSIFDGNSVGNDAAFAAGGAVCNDSVADFYFSVFINNTVTNTNEDGTAAGGGIYNDGSIEDFQNNVIRDNTVTSTGGKGEAFGGGLANTDSIDTIFAAEFSGNTVSLPNNADRESLGGGLYNNGYISFIDSVTFANNSADLGGGIANDDEISVIVNSTFSTNTAIFAGGGIFNVGNIIGDGGRAIVSNTFHGNTAGEVGGGIFNDGVISGIYETIIAGGGGDDDNCFGDPPANSIDNLTDIYTWCAEEWSFDVPIIPGEHYDTSLSDNGCTEDRLLGDFTCPRTHALLVPLDGNPADNPAIDLGDNCGDFGSVDQRGLPRSYVSDSPGPCDIGAYEWIGFTFIPLAVCNGINLDVSGDETGGEFLEIDEILAIGLDPDGVFFESDTIPFNGTVTVPGASYGTWTQILFVVVFEAETEPLFFPHPDVTCKAKNNTSAPIIASSDPAISKSGSPLNATVGETVVWTIQVWNPGSTATDAVFVNDPIPDMFDIVDVTTTHGSASVAGQVVTIDIGTLQSGETATIQITTIANDLAADGQVCNTAYIGLIEAVACVNIFPGELPPTGGRPVINLWLAALGVMLALGLGKIAFALKSKNV